MEGESPPSRTTILGSLLRGRPRNSSQSLPPDHPRGFSPPPNPPSPAPLAARSRRHQAANAASPTPNSLQPSASQPQPSSNISSLALSHMLRRRRSAGNVAAAAAAAAAQAQHAQHHQQQLPLQLSATTQAALTLAGLPTSSTSNRLTSTDPSQSVPPPPTLSNPNPNAPSHRIRLVPHLDSRRSLRFDAIGRDLREGDTALRIGRFTDRSGLGLAAINSLNSNKLAFRSKVVSRAHAEIWVEAGGKFFIRDTKSSSGTFLNHVRLSVANTESRPFQLKDGDILQLGVDYQGGAEDIYKSVKIRIEIGREWQAGANAFNTAAFKNLKALALPVPAPGFAPTGAQPGKLKSLGIPDCCICLFGVTIRQALFIAPCSHTFHYKCIRPILESHHPAFSCPLCRTFADLEEDVEVDDADWDVSEEDLVSEKKEGDGVPGGGGTGQRRPSSGGDEDEQMDVDRVDNETDAPHRRRNPSVLPEVPEPEDTEPNNPGAIGGDEPVHFSGEDDVDSDVWMNFPPGDGHGGGAGGANATENLVGATGLAVHGGTGNYWGSPGAGSSTSARGDSPIPISLSGTGQVAVGIAIGEPDEVGVIVAGAGGVGVDGETVSAKRKR